MGGSFYPIIQEPGGTHHRGDFEDDFFVPQLERKVQQMEPNLSLSDFILA